MPLGWRLHGVPDGALALVHTPSEHASSIVHSFPSLQGSPFTGTEKQPKAGLQLSAVQTLPSLQLTGVPLTQEPFSQ